MLVVPQAVADKLPATTVKQKMVVLKNGDKKELAGISIAAIPMYNLPETADSRHTKGRGNGYILTIGGKNIYISGDTEDIPEMRALKSIDIAFVCMTFLIQWTLIRRRKAFWRLNPKLFTPTTTADRM